MKECSDLTIEHPNYTSIYKIQMDREKKINQIRYVPCNPKINSEVRYVIKYNGVIDYLNTV
jgi:hypothetical protein